MPVSFALLDLQQEFLSLYPRRDVHICKLPTQDRWRTWSGTLEDHQILGVIADGGRGLFRGCHWSAATQHAVLDIDVRSRYHNSLALSRLLANLHSVGLQSRIYQSSQSGGWHIYLPFDCWEQSDEVELTLKRWLKALGYEIACGQLEVFPSGNALRLPLQPGFAWLDSEGNVLTRREELSLNSALQQFLVDFFCAPASWPAIKHLIEQQITEIQQHQQAISEEGFDELFTKGQIEETYKKGQQYWRDGLSEANQRHEAVLCIEHYLWYGDAEQRLPAHPGRFNDENRFRLIRAWLEQKHNGFCRHINNGEWKEVDAQIRRACLWRNENLKEQQPYPLTERAIETLIDRSKATGRLWSMEDLKRGNQRREVIARSKIKQAVAEMIRSGQQITRNGLAARSGCSPNTVSKHRDLWFLLATGSGDLNRGVQGEVSSSAATFNQLSEPNSVISSGLETLVLTEAPGDIQEASAAENSTLVSLSSTVLEFASVQSNKRQTRKFSGKARVSGQLFFIDFSSDRQYRFLIDSGED
jgi:hypothetical protein